jgi:hypothetical protein
MEEALELAREDCDLEASTLLLHELSLVLRAQGEYKESVRIGNECLAAYRAQGNKYRVAFALAAIAATYWNLGDDESSLPLIVESLGIAKEIGDLWLQASGQHSLGGIALRRKNLIEARYRFNESVRALRELDNLAGLLYLVESFGYLAIDEGDAETGARLLGAADALREEYRSPLPADEMEEYQDSSTRAKAALGELRFAAEFASGRLLSVDEALALGMSQ